MSQENVFSSPEPSVIPSRRGLDTRHVSIPAETESIEHLNYQQLLFNLMDKYCLCLCDATISMWAMTEMLSYWEPIIVILTGYHSYSTTS